MASTSNEHDLPPDLRELQLETEQHARDYGLDFYDTIFEVLDYDELSEIARRGPVPAQPWGISVSKPGSGTDTGAIYLHVIKPEIPVRLPRALLTFDAWLVGKTEHLSPTALGNEIIINVPEKDRVPIDTIIVLRPKGYQR